MSAKPLTGRRRHAVGLPVVAAVIGLAVGLPVAAGTAGGAAAADPTPAWCEPGTVVTDHRGATCSLREDGPNPPPGWSSAHEVDQTPGTGTAAPDPADDATDTSVETSEGSARPGEGAGFDPARYAELGVGTDPASGTLTYQGRVVRGLVEELDDTVVSSHWDDRGEVYLVVTPPRSGQPASITEVPEAQFPVFSAVG